MVDLRGFSVLIVEDEVLVAFDIAEQIECLGGVVLGPAGDVDQALRLVQRTCPDLALLDFELRSRFVTPLAEELTRSNVPFAVITGYPGRTLGHAVLDSVPRLGKPFSHADLTSLLARLSLEERIRRRAYVIWEEEDWPQGQADRHWRMAEQELRPDAGRTRRPKQADRFQNGRSIICHDVT